jgi:hypothetical protein
MKPEVPTDRGTATGMLACVIAISTVTVTLTCATRLRPSNKPGPTLQNQDCESRCLTYASI